MEKIGLVAIFDVDQFNEGLDDYSQGLNKANDATKKAEEDSFSFTRALEVFVGNALVKVGELALEAAGKVIEFGKESVALAADFETQMSILQTAAADSGKSVDELGEIMIAVGGDSRILGASATGAADAATNLFKAGLKTEAVLSNLNDFMEDGAKLTGALASSFDLAAATGLEVGRASEIAAINLATFGGELKTGAEQADFIQFSLDNLVKAADASVAEVADLSEALAVVGPSANAAGMSFQDTTNALALFSTAGITGSRAGTTLEATLRDLRKTTPKAQEMMDKLNISLYDQEGAMLPLIDIVGQFEQATADMTQEQRDQSLQAIFQAQGMRGIQVLLEKGVVGWNDMADAVEGATGIQEQAELRSKTFAGQMESLDGQIETLKIRFGQALLPVLADVIGIFSELIEQHGPAIEQTFLTVGEIIAFAVETIIVTLPKIREVANQIVEWFQSTFKNDMEDATEFVTELVTFLTNWFEQTLPKIIVASEKIVQWFNTRFMPFFRDVLVPIMQDIWELIQSTIRAALIIITELIEVFIALISGDWEAFWDSIMTIAATVLAWLIDRTGEVLEILATLFGAMLKKLVENWTDAWNQIKLTFELVWGKIVKFMEGIGATMKRIWEGIVDVITTPWNELGPKLTKIISGAIESVKQWFIDNTNQFVSMGKAIVAGMLKGIQDDIGGLITFIKGIAADIIGSFLDQFGIGSPSKVFMGIGKNIIQSLGMGITNEQDTPNQALMGVVGGMMNTINNVDNSVTNNIEINSTNMPQAPTQIFFDVVSALNAVSG